MKASEVIAELAKLMAEHGDLDVHAYDGERDGSTYQPVVRVEQDENWTEGGWGKTINMVMYW